jgi:riboflavin biosynthesis protein RibD
MNTAQIKDFMREAIIEGKKAIDKCGSNPPVGCVLVHNEKIISRGHTNKPGKPHAEAMALNNLKEVPKGTSAFVTLEPCSFYGKTPSCAKAIIKSGIMHVYVGITDPHPKNQGQGLALLKQAGISVEVGVLSRQIEAELEAHLIYVI